MIDKLARFAAAALIYGAIPGAAQAQETFSGRSNSETFNGSNRTGTQGVVGNPNCPPPVEIINGRRVTPLNWSCDSSGYWASQAPHMRAPSGPPHPGPAYVPGAANPCQPAGRGGYNWLNNPIGTQLPPGCVRAAGRPFTTAKRDSAYEAARPDSYLSPPVGPPGSYIQPDGKPGSYVVPPDGAPGSYLQPDGRPGSYLDSTANNGRGGNNAQARTDPRGATDQSSGANQNANDGLGRQDTKAMQGGFYDGTPTYRVDTGAMRAGFANGAGTVGQASQTPRKSVTANNASARNTSANSNAAANSQAARFVNRIINLFGNGP